MNFILFYAFKKTDLPQVLGGIALSVMCKKNMVIQRRGWKRRCRRTKSWAVWLVLDRRAEQIGRSVANGSPPLRCFFRAVFSRRLAAEMDLATYTLGRNIASIMKIRL